MVFPEKLIQHYHKKKITLKYSTSRKIVDKYEKNKKSKIIFTALFKKQYLKYIMKLIFESIKDDEYIETVDEFYDYVKNKYKKSMQKPYYMDIVCDNCASIIETYIPHLHSKPVGYKICPDCKSDNNLSECIEMEDWTITENLLYKLLDELFDLDIISKDWHSFCNSCYNSDLITYTKKPIINSLTKKDVSNLLDELYCPSCKNVYEIRPYYGFYTQGISFWKDGYWLEWYVKNLCKKTFPKTIIEQGILLENNDVQVEIDILILKNKKTYGIECKFNSPHKNTQIKDVASVLEYNDYVDMPILVTTGNITNKTEKFLKKNGINVVSKENIEKIARLLK